MEAKNGSTSGHCVDIIADGIIELQLWGARQNSTLWLFICERQRIADDLSPNYQSRWSECVVWSLDVKSSAGFQNKDILKCLVATNSIPLVM